MTRESPSGFDRGNPLLAIVAQNAQGQNEQENQNFVLSFLCPALTTSQRPEQHIFRECRQQQGVLADTDRNSMKYSTYAFLLPSLTSCLI